MEKKVGNVTLHNLNTYSRAIFIKRVWYWNKDRHKDQWDRIESSEINSHNKN